MRMRVHQELFIRQEDRDEYFDTLPLFNSGGVALYYATKSISTTFFEE